MDIKGLECMAIGRRVKVGGSWLIVTRMPKGGKLRAAPPNDDPNRDPLDTVGVAKLISLKDVSMIADADNKVIWP